MAGIALNSIRAAARDMKDQVGDDPEKARRVLRGEGVIDAQGKLTPRYRTSHQFNAEFLDRSSRR